MPGPMASTARGGGKSGGFNYGFKAGAARNGSGGTLAGVARKGNGAPSTGDQALDMTIQSAPKGNAKAPGGAPGNVGEKKPVN